MGSPWYRSLVCLSDSVTKQIKAWNSMANLRGWAILCTETHVLSCFVIIPRWTFSQALRSSRVSAWRWQIEMTSWWHTKGWCSLAQFFFGIQVCPHFSGTPLLCNSLIAIAWDSCFSPRMFAWLWHVFVANTAGKSGWKFTSSKPPTRSELSESISALSGGIVSPWNGWRMGITGITMDNWHYWPTDLGSNSMELYGVIHVIISIYQLQSGWCLKLNMTNGMDWYIWKLDRNEAAKQSSQNWIKRKHLQDLMIGKKMYPLVI